MTSKKAKQTNKKQNITLVLVAKSHHLFVIFFIIITINYFITWGGQSVRRPCFTHALQIIEAAVPYNVQLLFLHYSHITSSFSIVLPFYTRIISLTNYHAKQQSQHQYLFIHSFIVYF